MPTITHQNTPIHYTIDGSGPETILFGHGLLFNHRMWDAQVKALKDKYRCIRIDWRGQEENKNAPLPYDMDTLTEDARHLIETLCEKPCHYVGLSMGGFIGLRLGVRYPHLIRSMTLMDTSAEAEDPSNMPRYSMLTFVARYIGMQLVIGRVKKLMFGREFLTSPEHKSQREFWKRSILQNNPKSITNAVKGVMYRKPVLDQIHQINVPTLILVGEEDIALPPARSEAIHAHIPHSKLHYIPNCGHMAAIEQPDKVNELLTSFLQTN